MKLTDEQRVDQIRNDIDSFLGHDGIDGTYYYCLTRVKEAFGYGTMTLDDFVEVDEDFTNELVVLVEKHCQAAWEEVKRLKEENKRLKDLHMRTLMHIKEDLYWGDSDNAIDRVVDKFIQPILDRIQGSERNE